MLIIINKKEKKITHIKSQNKNFDDVDEVRDKNWGDQNYFSEYAIKINKTIGIKEKQGKNCNIWGQISIYI